MDVRRQIKLVIHMMLVLSLVLGACGTDEMQDNVSETSSEIIETELFGEDYEDGSIAEESSAEKIRDNVTMYYDLEEIVLDGNKIPSSHDTDYDLYNLMSVCEYKEAGVKLYAYEDPAETIIGYPFNKLKLLLEHDGEYQVFAQTEFVQFANMFGYCGENYPYLKDFDEGYECDFDNDGNFELVKFIITDYGTDVLLTDIIVFDYSEENGQYEAYHTEKNCFRDLINEAMVTFFDEYYCQYTLNVEDNIYYFENGSKICVSDYVECYINENGNMEVFMSVHGDPKTDGFWDYNVGDIVFEVSYIGEGKFSIKAIRYDECINIMDLNKNLW